MTDRRSPTISGYADFPCLELPDSRIKSDHGLGHLPSVDGDRNRLGVPRRTDGHQTQRIAPRRQIEMEPPLRVRGDLRHDGAACINSGDLTGYAAPIGLVRTLDRKRGIQLNLSFDAACRDRVDVRREGAAGRRRRDGELAIRSHPANETTIGAQLCFLCAG